MELPRVTQRFTSNSTSTLLRDTTRVIAEVIHTVLLSVFLELIETIFCVRAPDCFVFWLNHAALVSLISAGVHLILEFGLRPVQIWVLLPRNVVVGAGVSHRQYLIGFNDVSEKLWVRLVILVLVRSAHIRMILLCKLPILLFDLFWGRSWRNIQNCVVIFF